MNSWRRTTHVLAGLAALTIGVTVTGCAKGATGASPATSTTVPAREIVNLPGQTSNDAGAGHGGTTPDTGRMINTPDGAGHNGAGSD
jgi:hypothetical protein